MMLLAGGVFYTVGAIGFLKRWPRLSPSVFSYHEVWHAFTIIAAAAHLTAVWTIVT
jgi:hemolysin III